MRLPGGSSTASPVISGVPQGTVLGPLLFLIRMSDIDVLNAKVVSFADDTQLYSKISYVEDCDSLQSDLNCVYDGAKTNNIVLTPKKFKYLSFSTNVSITSDYANAYVSPNMYVINNFNNLKDLGIIMSSKFSFEQHMHIIELCKRCTGLCGWILRTFRSRESTVMMTLFKSLVLSRLGHTGTLAYSRFRWKGIRLFNSLPMHIRNITACPPSVSKKQLVHISPILDFPCLGNKY